MQLARPGAACLLPPMNWAEPRMLCRQSLIANSPRKTPASDQPRIVCLGTIPKREPCSIYKDGLSHEMFLILILELLSVRRAKYFCLDTQLLSSSRVAHCCKVNQMKRFAGVLLLILVASVSSFAIQAERPHYHAHVLTHVAKYSYKAARTVVKEASKPVVYIGKQLV
jgi:hypothetical protein